MDQANPTQRSSLASSLPYFTADDEGLLVVAQRFIVLALVYVGIPVLVISLMFRLFKYLRTAGNERKLLRIELGKLAEEVHILRQELKDSRNNDKTHSG